MRWIRGYQGIAKATGFTAATAREYGSRGMLPPPQKRDGKTLLFAREDVRYFMRTHNGRPNARKSAKPRKRSRN
jgi:hypothetical protein